MPENKTPEEKKSRKDYYKDWYENNKERVQESKRKRWKKDAKYRKKNSERKKAVRKIKSEERIEFRKKEIEDLRDDLRADGYSEAEVELGVSYLPRNWNVLPRVHDFGEDSVTLYPIAYLSARMVKSTNRIRRWHAEGILPPESYRDGKGWRWYSETYIKACAQAALAVKKSGLWSRRGSLEVFRKELERCFNE